MTNIKKLINGQNSFTNQVRLKHPKKGFAADYGGSRSAAIDIFCIACIGSSNEAKGCKSYTCPLWRYRPGSDKSLPPKGIPSKEEYKEAIDYMEKNDGRVIQGRKLGLSKHNIEE
jgi:hypothetical protein